MKTLKEWAIGIFKGIAICIFVYGFAFFLGYGVYEGVYSAASKNPWTTKTINIVNK